ncbi:M50 family metallopeptidase [Portibacter marinus]|uniref:M50 family metallopeptidase n=1 Tax=Portibacter marinus TaxID=2898660 RepID=UPI001F21405D|nr:M50 family metallopeptidase [Portibacter marinus]
MRNTIGRVLLILGIYLGLKYLGGSIGAKLLYPITLLVTFLHEFGHALGAVLTGGSVEQVQINPNGSGYTVSRGGIRSIIIMGGYIGSAILGNLLFYIGTKSQKLIKPMLYLLSAAMMFTAFFWFNSFFTTGILILFAIVLGFIGLKTKYGREVLMFIGLASILYIIQDFNVGPSSDLAAYADTMIILPATVWKYIWLTIVVLLFIINIRAIFRPRAKKESL